MRTRILISIPSEINKILSKLAKDNYTTKSNFITQLINKEYKERIDNK